MRKMGRAVIPLSLRDIYRDRGHRGLGFEIMLDGHAWPDLPAWGQFSRWLTPRIFLMANTLSAKKAARKIERRAAVNRPRRSQMRTYVRKVEEAIAAGDHGAAAAAFRVAEPLVMRAAQKGIVHPNTAARKVSRLSRRINALSK